MDRGLYESKTNIPYEKEVVYKFFPDAANQPTVPANPLNLFISSIVRVSQGLFRITLLDAVKSVASHNPALNVNAAGVVRFCQPGPVSTTATGALTVDVLVVDASAAVQDAPAANANNFISGTIFVCDVGTV